MACQSFVSMLNSLLGNKLLLARGYSRLGGHWR